MDMKPVPAVLVEAYTVTFSNKPPPDGQLSDYLKWLRFYLDFCFKYQHPPRDPDSRQPFLQKLASKTQPKTKQEQAAHSIGLYYETMRNWPTAFRQDAGEVVSPTA